jgi:hypothetical protein
MIRRLAPVLLVISACGGKQTAAPPPPGNDVPEAAPGDADKVRAVVAAARTAKESGDDAACLEQLATIDAAWLGSDADQEALELAMGCAGRTDDYCDYYLDAFQDEDPYCLLKLEVDLAPRHAFADAVAVPCGFATAEELTTVAIPGDADRCIAILPGAGMELEDLPDDGSAPPGTCPSLGLVARDGKITPSPRTGSSFLDSPSDCCHADALGIRRDPDTIRVVLSSDGPARDCFGGTASVDEFDVYAFDGVGFTLEQSLAVGMH